MSDLESWNNRLIKEACLEGFKISRETKEWVAFCPVNIASCLMDNEGFPIYKDVIQSIKMVEINER